MEKKSDGIRIFSSSLNEEFRSISSFKFLGYGISPHGLHMHGDVEERLKRKLSNLINLYLLHYIDKPSRPPNLKRAGMDFDWDLLGLVSEIRSMLYGGLAEQELQSFMSQGAKLRQMRGFMGFYALLDDYDALSRLDGWLASSVRKAYRVRASIFAKLGCPVFQMTNRDLIIGSWYNSSKHNKRGFSPDPTLPSFVRGWAAARKYYFSYGLQDVEAPAYVGYY